MSSPTPLNPHSKLPPTALRTPERGSARARKIPTYLWFAGAGIKGGMTFGETDDWGYKATVDKLEIHDLHATLLYLLGLDHTKLTFRFSGRDIRLTDVYGQVIQPIIS